MIQQQLLEQLFGHTDVMMDRLMNGQTDVGVDVIIKIHTILFLDRLCLVWELIHALVDIGLMML